MGERVNEAGIDKHRISGYDASISRNGHIGTNRLNQTIAHDHIGILHDHTGFDDYRSILEGKSTRHRLIARVAHLRPQCGGTEPNQ